MLPGYESIATLHRKYAPTDEAYELVFTHCQIVEKIAMGLLSAKPQPGIDTGLVRAGCLLHDIGVYSLYTDGQIDKTRYITHGVEGERILQSEHFDDRLCRMASHHTGVGVSKVDIEDGSLPLPSRDFHAESLEEKLVMYADKFHSKTPRFNTVESYARFVAGYGPEKAETFMEFVEIFGVPDLTSLVAEYGHPVV